ncbi:MAG: nitroreductase family protein [Armatimonadota bacterium]
MQKSPLMEIIQKRRSVRKFLPQKIEEWKIKQMVEAARLAPSACNIQPWRFIAVTDDNIISEIAEKALGGIVANQFAGSAPLIIVLCSDKNFVTNTLAEAYKGINYHQIDTGIAGEHLVLRAQELGIGTCWIGWFKEKPLKKILNIPSKIKVLSLIAAGYYNEEELPVRAKKKELEEILFRNKYKS